jgi:tetratricopeptide (TPR) repeat protein
MARGNERLASGDLQGALAAFARACEIEPFVCDHWRSRGHAQRLKGDAESACASYSRAIALAGGSDLVDCLTYRSVVLRSIDPGRALLDAEHAIQLDPRVQPAWFNKGEALLKLGKVDEAIRAFTCALQLAPSTVAHARRGAAFLEKGDHARAIQDLTRAIEQAPNAAELWFDRGYARAQLLDLTGADADLSRAIELDPARMARAYACRGLIRSTPEQPRQGVPDLARFLEIAPSHEAAPLVRARLIEARGGL